MRCTACGERIFDFVAASRLLPPRRTAVPTEQKPLSRDPDAVLHVTPEDMAVILEALKNPPKPNTRLAAAGRRSLAELDRRLAALDRGETVDPATVKAELALRSRAHKQALRPGAAHPTPPEVVERRVSKAGRKKP